MRFLPVGALAALALFLSPVPAEAGTAVRMDIPALVDGAGLAVEARVLSAEPVLAANGLICTEYLLAVDRTFWGADLTLRKVRLPGGDAVDGKSLYIPGVPRLVPGEDAILFLSEEGAHGFSMPIGLAQGKFRVVLDKQTGQRTLARTHAGLELLDPATGAVQPAEARAVFGYSETVARIYAAAAARKAREAAEKSEGGR